jgi:hypothetical protein
MNLGVEHGLNLTQQLIPSSSQFSSLHSAVRQFVAKKPIVWLARKLPSFATFGSHCLYSLQFALNGRRFQDIRDIQKNMTAE